MEKTVTVRFFEVQRHANEGPTFKDVLEQIVEKEPTSAREVNIAPYCRVRLERLEESQGNLMGELTRVQTVNFPSEVYDDRIDPLPGDKPLGHGVAFGFNPNNSILALQWDIRTVSLSRFRAYLESSVEGASFEFNPLLREDAWERFDNGPLRMVTLKVASPANLQQLEGEAEAVGESFRRLGGAYEAPYIKIEVSVGRKKEPLPEAIKTAVRQLVGLGRSGDVDLKTAKVTTGADAPTEDKKIDFIEQVKKSSKELELPNRDPEGSYKVRSSFVKKSMRDFGYWNA